VNARQFYVALVALSLSVAGASSFAAETSKSTDETTSAGSRLTTAARLDNNGRQIATLAPIPVPEPMGPIPLPGRMGYHPKHFSGSASQHWQKVTFSVPSNLGQAADFCSQSARSVGSVAAEKVLEISSWLRTFAKQMSSSPIITPGANIYASVPPKKSLEPVRFNNKGWFMPDGRVKTLVQQ
jgi:hypothetical protein